ncbi:MAG: stage II sporulation protein M [Terracidiphilus sp.]
MDVSPHALLAALGRARAPILWIGCTYVLSVAVGAGMVHAHNGFALRCRDNLVGKARQTAVGKAMNGGMPLRAAVGDFTGNLFLGAVPSTVMGLAVVMPFPWVAFRGWVGGIVSVDGEHISRLRDGRERVYYLGVLLLQLIPYTLAGGTGVRLGLASLFPKGRWRYPPERWMGLPAEGVRDVGRIYLLVVPMFLIASLVEFLTR